MKPCIPSAPVDLLLNNYIRLAQEFTDGATPQENFLQTVASDWRYERALQGIRLLAQHHVGQLVHAIIAWRQAVNEDIKKNYSTNNVVNMQGICKRASMEILFLEAAMQVLSEYVPEYWQDPHFQSFFKSMLHVAFRWLLNDNEYVPHQELALVRASVVQVSSKVIGVMSRIRLADVTAAFVQKMDERVSTRKDLGPRADANLQRSQALKLCAGMHSVNLSFGSDSELEQSTNFLKLAHPLNFTAAVKKSQVHHALCEMLTDIVAPLIRSNQPQSCPGLSQALLADWYNTVLRLKNEVGQWVNKHSKHTNVGYPLVTVLVCLVDAENYIRQVESMADFLVKQMKVKEYRLLCFKCLNYLVTSSLVRNKAAASNLSVVAWLDKVVKPVLTSTRKGGVQVQDQQEFVANIADLCPEYCVGSIVSELLQTDSAEAQLIALRTLHLVATSVPQEFAADLDLQGSSVRKSSALATGGSTSSSTMGSSGSSRRLVRLPAGAVLDLIRSGQHPFELQGIAHLLPRVQHQLGLLLTQYHRAFGSYLVFSGEAVPKDKQAQLELFRLVLRLLPYVRPEQWVTLRPLDYLSPYTAHADSAVRACARDALMSIVRGCPLLRGPVLANMAVFLAAIPDDAVQVTRECLLLLRMFMELWLTMLQEQRLSSSLINPAAAAGSSSSNRRQQQQRQQQEVDRLLASGSQDSPSSAAGFSMQVPEPADPAWFSLDLHRLEGVFIMLLCSFDESIRLDAYTALGVLRTLHQQLYTMAEELGVHITSMPPATPQQQQQQPPMPLQRQQQQQQLLQQAPGAAAAAPGVAGGSFSSVSTFTATDSVAAAAAAAAAGSVASGSGMFFRHKATASRDSADFMQALGQLETPEDEVLCVMDVLEEVGDDVARRCYWDFGDWSDLWRETKHVPNAVSLQAVMGVGDEVGTLRWTRCIVELVRAASHMCPTSMGVAYLEMLHKLSRYLTRDAAGRLVIPTDSIDGRRSEAWRALVVAVCVCPPSLRERVERAARKGPVSFTARDVVRALLVSLAAGSAIPQQVCLMALGHCSHEHYPILFEELPSLVEEYTRTKQRRGTAARPEEVRKAVANVLRLLADAMPPGTLNSQVVMRARYLDWIRDTSLFLKQLPRFGEAFWEVSQVAYCLCAVCRCIGHELVGPMTLPLAAMRDAPSVQRANSNRSSVSEPLTPGTGVSHQGLGKLSPGLGAFGAPTDGLAAGSIGSGVAGQAPMARKQLFEMFAGWCEEGDGEYQESLRSGISTALVRLRDYDLDTKDSLTQELAQAAEFLDQAARLAMAAMLEGPVFDTDARRAQGPVLRWIDRLLKAPPLGISYGAVPAVPKETVGRTALLNLLRSNLEMFSVCVDRCYDRDTRIATASFQVVSEVYSLHQVKVEPHVVLSLVLYKMVDSNTEVREDAMHMLQVLSMREWQTSATDLASAVGAGVHGRSQGQQGSQDDDAGLVDGGSGSVLVLGSLQDSYQQYQYELAVSLARDRPELSEALCEEMMTRQLELADKVSQHPVLTCLSPWMENLTIAAHWKGTWCERLLKSMYYVTLRHGDELPLEIERLWRTLAHNRRNIIPMLDFLASLGTHMAYQQELTAMLEYLGVSKRICLYLARKNAQQTIDHLVYEVSLQLLEDEGPASGGSSGGTTGSGGYQHHRAVVPLEFAAVLQQHADSPGIQRSTSRQPSVANNGSFTAAAPDPRSSFGSWWSQNMAGSSSAAAAAAAAVAGQSGGLGSSYPAVSAPAYAVGGDQAVPGAAAAAGEQQLGLQSHHRLSSSMSAGLGVPDSAASAGGSLHAYAAGRASTGGMPDLRESNQGQSMTSAGQGGSSLWGQEGAANMRASAASATDQSDTSSVSSMSVSGQTPRSTPGGVKQQQGMPAAVAGSNSSLGGLGMDAPSVSSSAALGPSAWEGGMGSLPVSTSQQGPSLRANWSAGGAPVLSLAGSGSGLIGAGGPTGLAGLNLATYYASRPAASGLLAGQRGSGVGGVLREEAAWLSAAGGIGRNSPRPTREPPSPVLRGLVTRPELALCLLTEVVYEHDEDVSSHLALLCHVCLLLADHDEHLVAAAAQQLLINCLYSLGHHYKNMMQEEHKVFDTTQATALIKHIQSMRGRRLWPSEDVSLDQQQELDSTAALCSMVHQCLDAFSFEPGLRHAWVTVSLDWALHARSRHLSSRSQQVLRSLQPQLTGDMCSILLLCLQQCLAAAEGSAAARDVALELLLTLRELVDALPARKLLLYPQVFWASMSLTFSSYVNIYKQGLLLLATCIQQLPLHDATTQNILLAAAPSGDPSRFQQLLAHCHAVSSSCVDRVQQGMPGLTTRSTSPSMGVAAAAVASGQSRYATAPAGRSRSGGFGAAAAAAAAAAGPFGSQTDVASSYVGGVDPQGTGPMRWPFAQMLPWPDRGPDGPAHQMLAVQQVLFKGLLFPETQLQAVQLFTLLAAGLCHLPPGSHRPLQAPAVAAAGGLDAVARNGASRERDQQPGSNFVASLEGSFHSHRLSGSRQPDTGPRPVPGPAPGPAVPAAVGVGSSASSSRSGSRATTATPPGMVTGRESLGDGSVSGPGPDDVMRSSAGGALGPGGVSVRAKAAHFWQSLQQEQQQQHPDSPRQQQQQAEQQGSAGGAAAAGAAVSRSAPELSGLRGRHTSSSTAGTADAQQQQQQQQPAAAGGGAAALQSSCSMWTSLMRGAGQPSSAAAAAHSYRRLPGTRAAFQCILGQRHAQLLVSIACIVPFFCSQLGQLEPDSELLEELLDCMHALAGACSTHGFAALGEKLQLFAQALNVNSTSSSGLRVNAAAERGGSNSSSQEHTQHETQPGGQQQQQQQQRQVHFSPPRSGMQQPEHRPTHNMAGGMGDSGGFASGPRPQQRQQPGQLPGHVSHSLLQLMRPLCLQLSCALLPTFADWLLRFWVGLLLLPGARQMHPHVLLLLKCLFDTPGLQLGPASVLLLDSSFLSPLVALAQGPLCQLALDALEGIINYAANCPDLQQQGSPAAALAAGTGSVSNSASQAPGQAAAAAAAAGPGVDLQGLAACCLPQLDAVELLQRVLESFGQPPRKKRQRLLPFLADNGSSSAGHTQGERMLDD